MNMQEYQRLKDKAEKLQTQASRSEGAYEQEMSQLRSAFGVSDVPSAKALLEKMRTELAEAEKMYEDSVTTFYKKWEGKV